MDQSHLPIMPSIPVLHTTRPYVRILEQPASRSLRFRYECEGRSAGSIVGANSTPDNRTYPAIQVVGYQGPAVVVVSCVTKEGPPYRPHPHNLVGREFCKRGICTMVINKPDMTCSFTSLGIQCVKKKDIEKSLQIRQNYQVDPFGTGFNHRNQMGSIDLNVVRLCFQVFLEGADKSFSKPLAPVVSESIYDKKAMSDLTIMKLSHYSAPVAGGTEVILLCDKVTKEDIQVWFYEEQGTHAVWEAQAEFQPSDVHKQVAIAFRTPRYYNESVQQPVPVFVELRRPSDNIRGEPRPFQLLPMERDPEGLSRKRLKIEENCLEPYLQENYSSGGAMASGPQPPIGVPRTLKQHTRTRIKAEPTAELSGGPCVLDQFQGISTTISPTVPVSMAVMTVASPASHLASVQPSNMGLSVGGSTDVMASLVSRGMDITTGVPLSHTEISCSRNILQVTTTSAAAQAESTTVDDAMIEKFDSLDIDSGELRQLHDFSLTLTENLSTSLFDSANNLIEAPLQQSAQQDEQESMPSEESLNRISQIQNELEALSKLCKNTEST